MGERLGLRERHGGQRDRELGRVITGFRDPALRRCRDYGKGRRAALAGGLVVWTGSPIPDWAIGGLIALLVLGAAFRILKLR